MPSRRILTSLLSGALGATASGLAKFAFDANSAPVQVATRIVSSSSTTEWLQLCKNNANLCFLIPNLLIRGICLVGMILCNALMLGTFLKGMEESGSIAGSALSTAANFILSACYGYLFWYERFSSSWWIGFGMVVAGVILLANNTTTTKTTTITAKRKSTSSDTKNRIFITTSTKED